MTSMDISILDQRDSIISISSDIGEERIHFSMESSKRQYFMSLLFVLTSIFIGTLIVCLTARKPNPVCHRVHHPTITDIRNVNSRPQSVAIANFNNDRYYDFVVLNTGLNTLDIYLGSNDGTFEHHNTYSTGSDSYPMSVAAADLDNKNRTDLAVANFGTNSIGIFLGYNNGSFTVGESFSTGSSHPLFIAIADLNRDDRLDIAVVNYGTNSIGLYLGSGDGSFALSMIYSTGYDSLPHSLAIADLNSDQHLDIVVANSGTNNIGLFLGNGNGTFEDQKLFHIGLWSNPTSVSIADVNHDSYVDVIVANNGTSNIRIFFGDRNGSFTSQTSYSTGMNSHPEYVAVYDVNKDGELDIIAIDSVNERAYILPGNENGTFPILSIYLDEFGSSPMLVKSADFNSDNSSGILIVNRGSNSILLLKQFDIKLSASYSTFTAEILSKPSSIASGDLNGDLLLDIVVVNDQDNLISIFWGNGGDSFTFITTISTGIASWISGIVLSDFNNDHQLDISVVNPNDNSFSIFFGHGDGTFSAVTTYSTGTVLLPYLFAVRDLNADNCLDIVIISDTSDMIGIYLGNCNGTFEMLLTYSVEPGSQPNCIVIDDFNDDNHVDFAIAYANSQSISVYFGDGSGRFPTSYTGQAGTLVFTFSIISGDFNNDNRTDIGIALFATSEIAMFFAYGNSTFANVSLHPLKSCNTPISMAVGDFNNDAQLDLAIACFYSNNIVIIYGTGSGKFGSETAYSTGDNSVPSFIISRDFNNDNQLDLATTDYKGDKVGILMNYYEAHFVVQTKYSTGFRLQPSSVATGDFNSDNILDLIVTDSGNDSVSIRFGVGDGSFEMEAIYFTGRNSFPQHVCVGHLNEDDYLDVIIANSQSDSILVLFGIGDGTFGNIFSYSMDIRSSPTSVAITNLNNDKWPDLVVANPGLNNLGFLFGYNYATFVLDQTYSVDDDSYPRVVSVADMNNDNHLDIVVANYFSSSIGIFFGYGNGTFTSQRIYSTGADSHPSAMAVADLNKDGFLDVVISNLGAESIDILLGSHNGTFEVVLTCPNLPYSRPSAIVVGDVNNDNHSDIIVTDDLISNVGIFLRLSNGSWSLTDIYSTGTNSTPNSLAVGDFNKDGFLDIVVPHAGTDSMGIFLGYGNGSFAPQTTYFLQKNSHPYSVALDDFNNDDQLDIAVSNSRDGIVGIFLGLGNGSFSQPKQYSIGSLSILFYLSVGDFNDDDQADIAITCIGDNAIRFLYGTKDGDFLMGKKYFSSDSSAFKMIAYGDFNNDSHLDFVVTNMFDDSIDVFLRNGSDFFATPYSLPTGFDSKPHSVAVDDFDHDNQSDIVVANHGTDNIIILLANPADETTNPKEYSTGSGSRPYTVVVGDFNDDNRLDIAVINSGTNDVVIFQGYGDGSFVVIGSYSTGVASIPHSIALADFNNDQRLDIAVANAGANNVIILFGLGNATFGNETAYSMRYNSRPYSLAVGDFNNDSWIDIAVANFEADYVEILLQTC